MLQSILGKGVLPCSVADRAGVSRACLSKFIAGKSKHLRADTFTRICEVALADMQRLKLA